MIPKNPLTMVGRLERTWIFNYHTPAEEAARILPPPLEPITHKGCAFWGVVISRVGVMRPKPLPALVGVSYWHIGYRLHARFRDKEGIWFARSDCDSALMTAAGNWLTDYNFHTATMSRVGVNGSSELLVDSVGGQAWVSLNPHTATRLPPQSAFGSLDEAAAFLKYNPRGISRSPDGSVNIVDITRDESAWRTRRIEAPHPCYWEFFQDKHVQPEIGFEVEPIAYQWNRGQRHEWRRDNDWC